MVGPAAVFDEVEHGMEGGLVAVVGHGQPSERSLGCRELLNQRLLLLAGDVRPDAAWTIAMWAHM